ncbi:rhox homeobox family member 2-like, partial [Pteropus medius]|uniref:rhox homeobox family member 2-like n=1 Tax=Pteropus vampyrus TaxID=132908 RepID=UPI00196BB1D2
MKPQRQRSQDATGFLSLGVDEEWEKLHEAKPVEMSLIGEGGEEEKGTQPKPEQGAASGGEKEIRAEEEAEEGSDGGPDGPCAPGAMNDENHEASDDSGGEPGEQRQEEQPLQAVVQHQQPWDREQVVQRPMFTLVQVQELERIFRFNAYPNLFMRQEIARRMNMPEARVQ